MDTLNTYWQKLGPIGDSLASVFEQFISVVPNIIGALVILLLGWIIAKFMRSVTNRILKTINADAFFERIQLTEMLEKFGMQTSISSIFSSLVYWVIYLVFITTALETLELNVVTESMYSLLAIVPNLIAAVIIFIIGGLAARFANKVVKNAAEGAGLSYGIILGKLAAGFIMIFMGIIALSTIGIDTQILTANLTLLIGGVVVAGAIAGGLGGRTVVENVLAANQLRSKIKVGQTLTMDDLSGTIEKVDSTGVVLKTSEGMLSIPAGEFMRIPYRTK